VNEINNQLTVHCYEGKVKTSYKKEFMDCLSRVLAFQEMRFRNCKKAVENEKGLPPFARFSGNFQDVPLTGSDYTRLKCSSMLTFS
jgi:hypothetical protein